MRAATCPSPITCRTCAPASEPPHPSWLPRQRRGTTPQMIGRYPDFDVFDAAGTWDAATAKVVNARLRRSGRTSRSSLPGRQPRCERSATCASPRTANRGSRWPR